MDFESLITWLKQYKKAVMETKCVKERQKKARDNLANKILEVTSAINKFKKECMKDE